jgi:hypothetical protein
VDMTDATSYPAPASQCRNYLPWIAATGLDRPLLRSPTPSSMVIMNDVFVPNSREEWPMRGLRREIVPGAAGIGLTSGVLFNPVVGVAAGAAIALGVVFGKPRG